MGFQLPKLHEYAANSIGGNQLNHSAITVNNKEKGRERKKRKESDHKNMR
jgi:hypothetical protein